MEEKSRLSIVYCDAGGLLYHRDNALCRDEMNAYLAAMFRASAPPLTTYRQVTSFLRDEFYAGQLAPEDWARAFLRGLGLSPGEAEVRDFVDFFVRNKGRGLSQADGAADAIAWLRARGVPFWVITDTPHPAEVKRRWLEEVGIPRAHVAEVISSFDAGCTKKDRRIFRLAVERSGVPIKESAFVGHAPAEIRSANQAGLLTISLEKGLGEAHYIPSLRELPRLLEALFEVPEPRG